MTDIRLILLNDCDGNLVRATRSNAIRGRLRNRGRRIMPDMRTLTVAVIALGMLWTAPQPRKISFARGGGVLPGTMQLFISASDGSDDHPLLAVSHDDYDPVWSPDGKSIVFTSDRNGSGDLFRVDPDGTNLTQLTSDAPTRTRRRSLPMARGLCL
jgi:hypothetical protein